MNRDEPFRSLPLPRSAAATMAPGWSTERIFLGKSYVKRYARARASSLRKGEKELTLFPTI